VDWIEQPVPDLLPMMRRAGVVTERLDDWGFISQLRPNHVTAPTSNVKLRLINGITGTASGLTLEADFNAVASNVLPAVASAYGAVAANTSMELDVTSALSSTPIYSRSGLSVAGSSIYTLFMVGDSSAPQGLLRRDR